MDDSRDDIRTAGHKDRRAEIHQDRKKHKDRRTERRKDQQVTSSSLKLSKLSIRSGSGWITRLKILF